MTFSEQQIAEWLDGKEDEHLESKEARSNFHLEKLVKYCAALANEGGVYLEDQRRWARRLPIAIARREDEAATANESKEEA